MKKSLLYLFLISSTSLFAQFQTTYPDYVVCDANNDGFAVFNLQAIVPQLFNGVEPANYDVTFHESYAAAFNNNFLINPPTSYTNTTAYLQTIYIRIRNIQTNSVYIPTMNLVVNNTPVILNTTQTACFDQGIAYFDLGIVAEQIWTQNNSTPNGISVSFYMTQADANASANPIGYSFTAQNQTTIIYVNATNTVTGCSSVSSLILLAEFCQGTVCNPPTNVSVTAVTPTTATLGWTSQNSETLWEVYITPPGGAAPIQSTTGSISNTNPYTVSGLICASSYLAYVRATCGLTESAWAGPFTFQTASCGTAITVNTTYTPTDLINNVILNTDCANATTIISQGNCGIAYFNNNQGSFPFEEGMLIRSGNANLSVGPYATGNSDSSTCSQLSDTDLATIISNTGQSGTVNDVSSVKFNFTANSNLLSFNFIFASNEYGQYQCQFSDVFGFILTDLTTGTKQNIAIIPGTTTPISTTTIRNSLYNTSCASVNAQYFGNYNVNNLNSAINFRGQTVPMTAFATLIPGRQYSLKLAVGDYNDNSFDSGIFIEGGSLAFGNQCQENIQLVAFVDENNNGIKDSNEVIYSQGTFATTVNSNPESIENTTSNGVVILFPENLTDAYSFSYAIYPELDAYFSTSTSYSNVVYDAGGTNIYYFPVINTQPYNDVLVSISSILGPTPGFSYMNRITYKNLGLTPVSGTLTYTKDSALSIVGVSQTGISQTPTGFTYDYTNLAPNESRSFTITLQVPTIPTVNLGQTVTNMILSTNIGDINSENNNSVLTQTIEGSYDPNDKIEAHGGKIAIDDFSVNDYLYYTIRFQNTGTANAQFVTLIDALDNRLDETSLRMVSASHNYVLTRIGNQLEWKFKQINLPASISNPIGSNGYVTFKIKVKPGFAVGDIIPNTAHIFFDYNPAIVTNTYNTEFVQTLSNTTFTNTTFLLFPNPASNYVQISMASSTEQLGSDYAMEQIKSVVLYTVLGKRVIELNTINKSQTTLNISSLAKGIYLIEVTSNSNTKIIKKLVIQ